MLMEWLHSLSIRTRYILALTLIAVTVTSTMLTVRYILKVQANDGHIINIAGQQRMLSQRLVLNIHRMKLCDDSLADAKLALMSTIQDFEDNHQYLKSLKNLPRAVADDYFGEAGVNRHINRFIDAARQYLVKPTCDTIPDTFSQKESDSLLKKLNTVVLHFERDAIKRVERIELIELSLWLFTLVLLVLEVFIIFRPLERKIALSMRSMHAAMEKAREAETKAVDANRAKSEFLASMSHELRTPMNGLFGMIELAIDNPSRSNEFLKKAKTAGRQLLVLINDVLDLSKIEAGKLRIEHIPFELFQVIDDVASVQSANSRLRNLAFEYNKISELPAEVIGDPTRISQVMHNLLSNAIKFTEQGKVTLEIGVFVESKKYWLKIVVSDTGIGIEPAQLDRIFNRFEQAEQTHARRFGGTGLGLSITKQLVTLMGGTIDVDSTPGKGSLFTARIPIEIDQSHNQAYQPKIKLKVAVIDDLQTSREYLQHVVKMNGYDVKVYDGGKDFLRDLDGQFDLLLLDLSMPGMDGIELLRHLIGRQPDPFPHVIMISAVLEHLDCEEEIRKKIWRTHAKPVVRNQLVADLRELQKIKLQLLNDEPEIESDLSHKILVVEDNVINAEVVKSMLEHEGYQVSVASDGEKAVRACILESFDLILMDIQMPVMDGLEATRLLREKYHFKRPIVALTANAFSEDRRRCEEAGMNDFLAKPIDKIELINMLKMQLN